MTPISIWVAEDNPGDIILFREALQHHQIEHQLYVLTDGQDALDHISRIGSSDEVPTPDVLLLDLNLPKAEGAVILGEFRKRPECRDIPVIVVTSSDNERDRAKVAGYGPTQYFRKPSDFDEYMELGSLIRDALRR